MFHLIAVIIIIELIIGFYVYRDATRRGMRAALWVVISVISVPVGLIVYMLIRKKYPHNDIDDTG